MDDVQLIRLNEVLRQASEEHSILKYDDCRDWFQGSNEAVESQVAEVTALFNEALKAGYVNQWAEPGETGWYWDWTGDAIRKAKELGTSLVSPLGQRYQFKKPCDQITTVIESVRPTTLTALAEEPFQHCESVYEHHVRYVISHDGKPVAALVPLVDLELAKDLQLEVDPCRWVEWVQAVRERLGWPPVTFDEEGQ